MAAVLDRGQTRLTSRFVAALFAAQWPSNPFRLPRYWASMPVAASGAACAPLQGTASMAVS